MQQEHDIREIAAAQHGALSRNQLREAGVDRYTVRRRIQAGLLVKVSPRVFIVHGSPPTDTQRCWCAVLDADGVISHDSALASWGTPGFDLIDLEVTRLRGGRERESHLATVHEPRLLMPHHLTMFGDVPLTTPARTLFDVAGRLPPRRLERALDTMWAAGLVNRAVLDQMMDDLAKRGRPGISTMRDLLADRAAHYRPPESGLEARFQDLMKRAGLGSFERQVNVGGEDTWLGRSDFRHQRRPVVVFVDHARWHSALIDRRRDEEQRRELEDAGFEVVRVTDVDVWHRPAQVVELVRVAVDRSGSRIVA
ncbi:MAG TPA: type IV toxin-antitoxin system AbiEi family antitoxin domain-containing protein [Microthrixaceae bacterium]|nr:type IV toxin-antitoxin system AbiEi family antitoxin domain-containing protein [Microthrixaceae bacterium]